MNDLVQTWDNLPTWAKIAIPVVAIAVIVIIWAPWRKNTNSTTLPSSLNSTSSNATSYVAPITTGSSTGNYTAPITTVSTGNASSPVTVKNTTAPAPAPHTTSKLSELGANTFVNHGNTSTYTETVVPSQNIVKVHNNNTGENYNQTLNSYFNYLHNPVGALGPKYTHGQQVADTLYYHYGIKNQSQLLQALNNPNNPAHNTANEFHNILVSNGG